MKKFTIILFLLSLFAINGNVLAEEFKKGACPNDLIIHQNLKTPEKGEGYIRNGKYHWYTKTIVQDAHILQKHLNRLGFNAGKIDGIIGPNTKSAILRLQNFLKTKADGYVGPKTRALINNSCSFIDETDDGQDSENWQENFEEDLEGDQIYSITYRIKDNNFTLADDESMYGAALRDKTKHKNIIQHFVKMIPSSYRKEVTTFKISNDPEDAYIAFARENDENLTDWTISFNISGIFNTDGTIKDKEDLNISLVHEFAHVLTLNATQLNPIELVNGFVDCGAQLYPGEGCAKPSSIINVFYKKFWEKEDYEILGSQDGHDKLHDMKPDSFINYYSATNPSEDIAESFTRFALWGKPSNSTLIKDQKILFFYRYPELVTLRNNIREALK